MASQQQKERNSDNLGPQRAIVRVAHHAAKQVIARGASPLVHETDHIAGELLKQAFRLFGAVAGVAVRCVSDRFGPGAEFRLILPRDSE